MRLSERSPSFGSRNRPPARTSAPIGSIVQNSMCQLFSARRRMKPDTVGPMAGATAMTMDMLPIIVPRLRSGTRRRTVVMSRGSSTAVPAAWMTRPMMTTVKPGAMAPMSVPATNRPWDTANSWRSDIFAMRKPVTGMTTAIVSRKPVVTHWARPAVMARSSLMTGMATLMIVSLRIAMNAAANRT